MSSTILLILRFLLALSLYVFLGWALLILWRELKRQSADIGSRQHPTITLLRQDLDNVKPNTFTIQEVFVGRDPACNYFLDDSTISAKHARLFYKQGQWWVEDLHSTNGTYLNQVELSAPLVLSNGDLLRCGQLAFRISIGERAYQDNGQNRAEETDIFE
jgi:hypothetical protein